MLFSGEFQRSGRDLIISDPSHRLVVRDYFQNENRRALISPEGALLNSKVVEALTGHIEVAQAGGAPAGKVVGHIVKMTGSASVVRNGVTVVLNVGDAVYGTDLIQTGSNSTLGLVLNNGTAFNLSANSRLMLNDLTYDAASTSNSSLITLVQGAASFVAGQIAKTGDMKVATPVGVVGIRGTAVTLDISSTDGTVSISVLDQRDGQVHSVQVYDTRGNLIGTVTSTSAGLTLTPTATEVIARQNEKSTADVAKEFNAFQGLLSTYDAGKQMFPNLPQRTENNGGDGNNTNPNTTTASSSAPADSQATKTEPLINTTVSASNNTTPVAVVVTTPAANNAGSSGSTTTPTTTEITVNVPTPAATVIGVVNGAVSRVVDNGFSNDATLTITGTAEPGSTVTIYDTDGATVLGSGIASGGSYSITTSALSEGVHTLAARARDTAGFWSKSSTTFHVTIDTTTPAAPLIGTVTDDVSPVTRTVADNGFSNDTTLTIAGTAEAGHAVTIYDTDRRRRLWGAALPPAAAIRSRRRR